MMMCIDVHGTLRSLRFFHATGRIMFGLGFVQAHETDPQRMPVISHSIIVKDEDICPYSQG